MRKTMNMWTLTGLAVLACAPAAVAQGDPDAPASEPPATANPMDGTAQPGNLGAQVPSGGPRASSNAEVERAQPPGPPDFPENNELPEHGGPDLPPRPAPPAAQQQQHGQEPASQAQPAQQPGQQEPAAQQQPEQSVSQPAPQAVQAPRQSQPVPDQEPAQQPVAQPARQPVSQPQQPPQPQSGLLPGAGDVGSLVSQVLGFLPHVG